MKIIDHQRFYNVTAGAQSIIISVAVFVGGLWTLGTYVIGDLSERFRRENLGLSISVEAKQEKHGPDPKAYYISALVKITNRASAPRFVQFEKYVDDKGKECCTDDT